MLVGSVGGRAAESNGAAAGHTAATNAGSTVAAEPRRLNPATWSRGVGSGLIWITVAPARAAATGISAAGCTRPEVPIASSTSQLRAAATAAASRSAGSGSPNHTTPGRTN